MADYTGETVSQPFYTGHSHALLCRANYPTVKKRISKGRTRPVGDLKGMVWGRPLSKQNKTT